MARFLGTVNTRLGSVDSGFTKAAVFTSPGTTSFTLPGSATKAKVIVVGAGSNYRQGTYCAASQCCYSGVSFPRQCYTFQFKGHLTGAGGGYAEKLYTAVGGSALTVQVASPSITDISANIINSSNVITGISGNYSYAIAPNSTITAAELPVGTFINRVANVSVTAVGNITVGSSTISFNAGTDMANIFPGATITGPGLFATGNATITAVNNGSLTATLNQSPVVVNNNGTYSINSVTLYLSNAATSTNSTSTANIAGVSISTVSGSGITPVSASSGTDAPLVKTCTNSTSAMDNSLWNPINIGFELPVCGYTICYNGHYNVGGTGSGGDVNRTGGVGVLMPDFTADSIFDGALAGGGGSGTYTCTGYTYNPQINCACAWAYHTVFGTPCGGFPNGCCSAQQGCACYYMCAGSIAPNCKLVISGATSDTQYKFVSTSTAKSSLMTTSSLTNSNTAKLYARDMPFGFGGQAGTDISDGTRGTSYSAIQALTTSSTSGSDLPASGGGCQFTGYDYRVGYDYSFGGNQYLCMCMNVSGGCASSRPAVCGYCACSGVWTTEAICVGNTGYNYVFGSQSSATLCYLLPRQCPTATVGAVTPVPVTVSYDMETPNRIMGNKRLINLNTYTDASGTPLQNLEYSTGAGASKPAAGGGGNPVWPVGGSGAVIILY